LFSHIHHPDGMGNNSCANNVPPVHAAHYRMFSGHDLSGSPGMNITIVKARGLRPPAEAAGRRPAGHRPTGVAGSTRLPRPGGRLRTRTCRSAGPSARVRPPPVRQSARLRRGFRSAGRRPSTRNRGSATSRSFRPAIIAVMWYATTRTMPRRRSRFHRIAAQDLERSRECAAVRPAAGAAIVMISRPPPPLRPSSRLHRSGTLLSARNPESRSPGERLPGSHRPAPPAGTSILARYGAPRAGAAVPAGRRTAPRARPV